MKRVALTVLLACSVLLSSPSLATEQPAADLESLQQQLAETLEANNIPGAGFALVQDGEATWTGGIGHARLEPEQHVISNTRFRIGSVTKIFTSLAVLKLVEQGRLSLDQPVHEIAPELPIANPWQATHPVTVAQLLEHTAGFDDMHFRNMNTREPLPQSLAETMMRLEDELAVRWQPGVMHSYSNPGYAVAGYLVEKISGRPFHEYVSDEVLVPLGMQETLWGLPDDDHHFAQGYTTTGDGGLREVDPRAIRLYPAGELSASPADLANVLRFFLQRGELDGERLLKEETIARMERPETTRAARKGLENGYGLANYTSFREGFRLQGHNGGLDGFTASLAYSPEHDFGYVILVNRGDGAALRVLETQVTEFLAAAIAPPEPGALDAPGAAVPANAEGCYRMMNSRNELLRGLEWLLQVACIEQEANSLVVRHPVLPQVTRFLPVDSTRLREGDSAWATSVFMDGDAEHAKALQWAGIYFEEASRIGVTLPLLLAIAALLLMASALLFFPVWMFRWWRGGLRNAPAMSARAWPLVATILFALTIVAALQLELSLLDSINSVSLAIFVGGLLFSLSGLYSLYRALVTWNAGIHPAARWHSLLVAIACAGLVLYLMYWRLVPLMLWNW